MSIYYFLKSYKVPLIYLVLYISSYSKCKEMQGSGDRRDSVLAGRSYIVIAFYSIHFAEDIIFYRFRRDPVIDTICLNNCCTAFTLQFFTWFIWLPFTNEIPECH